MPWLRTVIPSTGRLCWYHIAIECSDVGSSSSLGLSWFELSPRGMILATMRGVVKEIMFWWTKVFCDRRFLEPLVFPILPVTILPLVHMITGFTNIVFSTLGTCYEVNNIGRLTTCGALKLDDCPRSWLRDLCGGYHFASFASSSRKQAYIILTPLNPTFI